MEGQEDDPSDDVTHWVGNLPEQGTDSSECTNKRTLGRQKQSDLQCKELSVAEGRKAQHRLSN